MLNVNPIIVCPTVNVTARLVGWGLALLLVLHVLALLVWPLLFLFSSVSSNAVERRSNKILKLKYGCIVLTGPFRVALIKSLVFEIFLFFPFLSHGCDNNC